MSDPARSPSKRARSALDGSSFPVMTVQPWPDPRLDRFGHDPRSPYVERFWLPIVGPSGTLLLRWLVVGFDDRPDGYVLDMADAAVALGLVRPGEGPSATFQRSLERVIAFGFAQIVPAEPPPEGAGGARHEPDLLAVRRRLPYLRRRQLQQLPRSLRNDHDTWLATQPSRQRDDECDDAA